jgi:hypothetical protein
LNAKNLYLKLVGLVVVIEMYFRDIRSFFLT